MELCLRSPAPASRAAQEKGRRLGRRRRRRRRKRSRRRTEPRRPARRGNAPLQMSQPVSMGPSRCPKRAHPETKPPNLKQPHPPLRPKTKVAGSFRLSGNPATHHTRRYHVQDNVPVRRLQKMLVRAGLRCRCHYALRCPDLFRDERGTEHYRSCLQPS